MVNFETRYFVHRGDKHAAIFQAKRTTSFPGSFFGEGKTLVGAGYVAHRKLIASGGVGNVSYYMLPLAHLINTSIARGDNTYACQNTC